MAGAWLAESVQQAMLDPKVVSSSPALDVEFTLKKKTKCDDFITNKLKRIIIAMAVKKMIIDLIFIN